MTRRALILYGLVVVAAIVIDQIIKVIVEAEMAMGLDGAIDILPFFALYRTHNYGIAFSLFASLGPTALIVMTLAVVALVATLAWRTGSHQGFARAGFALIIGGAIGNLIDRVSLGYVVDYFLFHTPVWSFAIFNLADAFITVGAGLVVLQELVDWRRSKVVADHPSQDPGDR